LLNREVLELACPPEILVELGEIGHDSVDVKIESTKAGTGENTFRWLLFCDRLCIVCSVCSGYGRKRRAQGGALQENRYTQDSFRRSLTGTMNIIYTKNCIRDTNTIDTTLDILGG
jgi:hypothetical protein